MSTLSPTPADVDEIPLPRQRRFWHERVIAASRVRCSAGGWKGQTLGEVVLQAAEPQRILRRAARSENAREAAAAKTLLKELERRDCFDRLLAGHIDGADCRRCHDALTTERA